MRSEASWELCLLCSFRNDHYMGILKSLFGKHEPNPEWAATLTREGYLRFLAILRRRLDREGRPYSINDAEGEFHFDDYPDARFGLWNLAQVCRQNGGRDWVEIIDDHVSRVLSFDPDESSIPESFDDAKTLLFPGLYPLNFSADGIAEVSVCSAFRTVITCDLGQLVAIATRHDLERWDKTEHELYRLSLENLWRTRRGDARVVELPSGSISIVAEDDNLFIASHALQLNRYLFPEPECGALLAIPNQHSFLFHPIGDRLDPQIVSQMLGLAHGGYVRGPGSITQRLLWYREGVIVALDLDESGNIVGPEEAKDTPLISS